MGESLIIIGGGIAGLAAGCYARMNDYDTHIFEMHDKPGGLCTAWRRKDYTIDGCLHWLSGSAPGSPLYDKWMELGMIQGQEIINHEAFLQAEGVSGDIFRLYSNIDQLESHMLKLAPEDSKLIKDFTKAGRKFISMLGLKEPSEINGLGERVKAFMKIMPLLGDLRRWGRINGRDFSARFKNPFLRSVFEEVWMGELSALGLLFTMAGLHEKICGYVIGGSMRLSNALEKRYLDLGGTIDYNSRVDKILTRDDKAVGIRLADGVEHRSDYVVSAADGHSTIFDMLNGDYINDAIRNYYQNMPIFPPLIYVGLGVNMTFEDEPQLVTGFFFELDNPIVIGGQERKWLNVRIANYDPTLAPPGKTILTSMFFSDYEYWRDLSNDHDKYEAEKEEIASLIIEHLDDRFPGLASAIEMKDVATPLTFKRYTGNWQGSFEGWLMTPENFNMRIPKTLPGLDSFYMAGQWVQPGGGLPGGVNSGCEVIQLICRNDGRSFTTMMP